MKAIITGSTGMIGKGVLLECIDDPAVEQVLLINRNPVDIFHPKVKEIIHDDFRDFTSIKYKLTGYDACFHCMGVSSAGMSEEKYTGITYAVSESLASTLYDINRELVFIYVSGQGTDSTEKGNAMWARVKGKTENMILNKGFKNAYMFRPGAIIPERGVKSRTKLYNSLYLITRPFYPLLKRMKPVTTTVKIGRAMINLYNNPQPLTHLKGADINRIAGI